MVRSIFEFQSYKDYLKFRLRKGEERGALSRAAEAINCQRSYLSRVMDKKIHLTPDHGYLLGLHFKLGSEERDYFCTMLEHERAGNSLYREHLKTRLKEARKKYESLSERSERPPPALLNHQQISYFSSWHWSAIHFLTAASEFQTPEALASRLGMTPPFALKILNELEAMGLVRHNAKRWQYESGSFHLPKDSPLVIQHHQNWRARAVLDAQMPQDGGIHYTNVQTISKADIPALIEVMLNFIENCKEVLDPSGDEEVVAITCDVFKV